MHNQFKILLLCRVYTAQHVSGTVVPIIRSPLQLPLQPTHIVTSLVNRPQLEARPTRQSYANQWLQRQLEGAPDDGHNSARNLLSGVYATKQ
jgi:hypothetical protein